MNYNLIQLGQLNRPEVSGYILEVVSPYTGSVQYAASGTDNQVLVKSGIYSVGSSLLFVSGKFAFGIDNPAYDFHLNGKSLGAGTGYFEDLFINSDRVATSYEVGVSGAFLLAAVNALNQYVTTGFLSSGQINSLYYPRTNPSGYLTTSSTGQFLTTGQTGEFATTGWVNQNYYPRSNPSGFGNGGGLQNLSFNSGTSVLSITSGDSVSLGVFLKTGDADSRYALQSNTGNFVVTSQTGGFITTGQTGLFYPRSNPSGFALSSQTGSFVTSSQTGLFVTTGQTGGYYPRSNPSGYLLSSQTGAFQPVGSYVFSSETGVFATMDWVSQYYYPRTNPSGYGAGGGGGIQSLSFDTNTELLSITSGNSVSLGTYLTTGKADNRYALASLTGIFITSSQTGQFQPVGSYVLTSQTGDFITNGQTGQFQPVGSYVLNSQTGVYHFQFYPLDSNPAGYITTGQTGQFQPVGSYVTESQTGTFITTGQTGQFSTTGWVDTYYYPRSNPSGYGVGGILSGATGVSMLNGLTGNVFITGIGAVTTSVTGQIIYVHALPSSESADISPAESYSFFIF